MRAITGAIVSSQPYSISGSSNFLSRFTDSAASHLPSPDCATYLTALADAIMGIRRFRRNVLARLEPGATNLDADGYEDLVKDEGKHRGWEGSGDMAIPAVGHHDLPVEPQLEVAAGEKKSKKRKKEKEAGHEERAVPGPVLHGPASPDIAGEKRRKKGKHLNNEFINDLGQDAVLVVKEELMIENKKVKNKREKGQHANLKEDTMDVKEASLLVEGMGSENKSKKKNKKYHHVKLEENAADVKEVSLLVKEELGSEKKKGKKKKEKDPHVQLEEDLGDMKVAEWQLAAYNGDAGLGTASGKERKKKKHDQEEGDMNAKGQMVVHAGDAELGTVSGKERKKKKHEQEEGNVNANGQMVVYAGDAELGTASGKGRKKKKHVQEEGGMEAMGQIVVYDAAAGLGTASGEKKRKKKKHVEGESGAEVGKEKKEEMVIGGDQESEKRKKKRGRDDQDANDQEQAEQTKKQRKHS